MQKGVFNKYMSENIGIRKSLKILLVAILKLIGAELLSLLLTAVYLYFICHFMGWTITSSMIFGIWLIISMAEKEIMFVANAIRGK